MNERYYTDGHDVQPEAVLMCWYRDMLISVFGVYKAKKSFYFPSFTLEGKFPRLFRLGFVVWLFQQGWKKSSKDSYDASIAYSLNLD